MRDKKKKEGGSEKGGENSPISPPLDPPLHIGSECVFVVQSNAVLQKSMLYTYIMHEYLCTTVMVVENKSQVSYLCYAYSPWCVRIVSSRTCNFMLFLQGDVKMWLQYIEFCKLMVG